MSREIVTKAEFQKLAERRLAEAKALLDLGMWDGAYDLAGYAVELALKACIIKRLMSRDAFPERNFSGDCYTHKIQTLIDLAGREPPWEKAKDSDISLLANYAVVIKWSEQKRDHRIAEVDAEDLYMVIAQNIHGVFPWIKTHWKRKSRVVGN